MLALWVPEQGSVQRLFNAIEEWKRFATDVRGHALDGGHFLAEEEPDATLAAVEGFLDPA